MAQEGIISLVSLHSPGETVERLVAAVSARNMIVFARIDHAAGAKAAGLPLRPTEVVVFGNPKGGTVLMQDQQLAGLDLPLKALVWEDAEKRVWLSYDDPTWIAKRYGLGAKSAVAVDTLATTLHAIAEDVTK